MISFSLSLFQLLLSEQLQYDGRKINANNRKISCLKDKRTGSPSLPLVITSNIVTLYLSNNYLKDLENIEVFSSLRNLSVANNCIKYYHEVKSLRSLQLLEKLCLDGNPICFLPFYREIIIDMCPQLHVLDDRKVSIAERKLSTILRKKFVTMLEVMNLNELHIAVISHIYFLRKCHLQMMMMFPRFRYFSFSHRSNEQYLTDLLLIDISLHLISERLITESIYPDHHGTVTVIKLLVPLHS